MLKNSSVSRSSIDSMFEKYKRIDVPAVVQALRAGDESVREALTLNYVALAGSIAANYAAKIHRDPDDILAVAMLGLVEAVDRLKDLPHDNYGGFVQLTINGTISKYLERDFVVKPPNSCPKYVELRNTGKGFTQETFTEIPDELYYKSDNLASELCSSKWFTKREQMILKLKSEGFTNKEIAEQVNLHATRVDQIIKGLKETVKRWLKVNSCS